MYMCIFIDVVEICKDKLKKTDKKKWDFMLSHFLLN